MSADAVRPMRLDLARGRSSGCCCPAAPARAARLRDHQHRAGRHADLGPLGLAVGYVAHVRWPPTSCSSPSGNRGDQLLLPAVGGHGRDRHDHAQPPPPGPGGHERLRHRARDGGDAAALVRRRARWPCWRSRSACATTASCATTSTRGRRSASSCWSPRSCSATRSTARGCGSTSGRSASSRASSSRSCSSSSSPPTWRRRARCSPSARLRIGFRSAIPPLPYLLPMLALFALVMLIVVACNDLGTALLFFGIFLTMLFVATGRRSYVLIGLLLFVAGSFVAYQLFGHVQRARRRLARPIRGSARRRLPARAGALRARPRRPLRRGARPGPADRSAAA